jgi:hypothetical protein
MNKTAQFKATLELLVPLVIKEIMKKFKISEEAAFTLFYSSKLYGKIEDEETKLWHFSPLALADILRREIETGKIFFPEET